MAGACSVTRKIKPGSLKRKKKTWRKFEKKKNARYFGKVREFAGKEKKNVRVGESGRAVEGARRRRVDVIKNPLTC